MSEGGGLNLARAVVSITGDHAPLKAALTGAKQATDTNVAAMQARLKKLGATFSKVGRSMTRYVTLPIVAAFGLSVRAFGQQEDAVNALSAALANAGEDAAAAVPKFKRFAAAMQQQTIYGDELILSQMAYAKNLGVTTDQLEDAAKAAIGLAAKYKIDLQTAMMLVGRASKGQTQMLTRYGIVMDESLSAQEKFNQLLVIGAGAFGLAEAEAKTMTGQLGQMKNAVSDAAEEIGKVLAPTVKRLALAVKEAARDFSKSGDESKKWAVKLAAVAGAIGPVLIGLGLLIPLAIKGAVVLGGLAAVGATMFVGWHVGRMIAQLSGLDLVILRAAKAFDIFGEAKARATLTKTELETREIRKQVKANQDKRAAITGVTEAERQAALVAGDKAKIEAKAKAEAKLTDEKVKQLDLQKQLSVVGIRGLWAAGLGGIADATKAEKKAVTAGGTAPRAPEEVDQPPTQRAAKPAPDWAARQTARWVADWTAERAEQRAAQPPQLAGDLGGGVPDVFTRPFSGERGTVGAAENPLAADTVTRVLDRIAMTLADIRQQGLGQPEPAPVPIP